MPPHRRQQDAARKTGNPKPYTPSPDELKCYELYASDQYTHREVAEMMGYGSHGTSIRTYDRVNAYLVSENLDNIREERQSQAARVANVRRAAMKAFERSQEDEITIVTGKDGERTTVKSRDGGAEFLRIVTTCEERLAKLLGLDAATKYSFDNPEGEQGRVAIMHRPETKVLVAKLLEGMSVSEETTALVLADLPATTIETTAEKPTNGESNGNNGHA